MMPGVCSCRRYAALATAMLAAGGGVIAWVVTCTSLDRMLADRYFSPVSGFVWRDAWLTAELGHHWAKVFFIVLGVLVCARAVWLWRHDGLAALRTRQWLAFAASALVVPLVISLLKRESVASCPWAYQPWGGALPWQPWWQSLSAGVPAGHCFPAGHASTALWLAGGVALDLPARPWRALAKLPLWLAPGFALGWMQQMRGAHFLSHTLVSVWLSCALVALLCWPLMKGAQS
ncbi:phosphatase PAP2 family protein [Chitinibacteraceae bacterium HSL-7]